MNTLLELSRRSFMSLHTAMNTVGQNVANATTEGYARRRVVMGAEEISSHGLNTRLPAHAARGAGVSVQTYERMRDGMLAARSWESGAGLGGAQEEHRVLSTLESLFPTGPASLHSQLNEFWGAWNTLADHPTESGARAAVRGKATTLTTTLNRLNGDITRLAEETADALTSGVEKVNTLLKDIAALNGTISAARFNGAPNLSAEDQRDQLVKQLSEFAPVRVQEQAEGYAITLNGMTVVQAGEATTLTVGKEDGVTRVTFGKTDVVFTPPANQEGRIGAWLRTLNTTLPDARQALNGLTETLVSEVNALHRTGHGLDGVTNRNFFDPAGLSAGTIRLSDEVLASPAAIAASGDGASGDSTIASAIAALQTQRVAEGHTLEGFAVNLVARIGVGVNQAASRAEGQAAVRDHLGALEQSVSGVSIEEEMTQMIAFQQAFAATARVLNSAQEMMDTLLSI